MPERLRVFLADDHAVVREGLKSLLNAQPDMQVIGEAADGLSALRAVERLRPDVVVMDVTMPHLTGAQATVRLRQTAPDVRVLALTVHEDKAYLRQLLEAGAAGYVLKRAAADELVEAIRKVAAGCTYLDPAVAGRVVDSFVRRNGGPVGPGAPLSDRETEVVKLVARGFSNKEIAAQLDISVKTVETYKQRLMQKLDMQSRADIVRYAVRQGWLQDV